MQNDGVARDTNLEGWDCCIKQIRKAEWERRPVWASGGGGLRSRAHAHVVLSSILGITLQLEIGPRVHQVRP